MTYEMTCERFWEIESIVTECRKQGYDFEDIRDCVPWRTDDERALACEMFKG